jgi:ornithine carbamoyltransferase
MMTKKIMKRDYLSIADFSQNETWDLLLLARKLKKVRNGKQLVGKTVGLIFQKPSTRTTVSFAVGVTHLGGQPLILNADILQLKRGETPKDTGRVLSRYLDGIVMRADWQDDIAELARYATIPVISGLTDKEHPCQVLADLLTIMDHKKMKHPKELKGFRLSYLGDGNNVAQSLMLASAMLGMHLKIACPKGYEPKAEFIEKSRDLSRVGGGSVEVGTDPFSAALQAEALYTDVWTSMGQEAEKEKRRIAFAPYQINQLILSKADPAALVMHCLPAHRGEEITDEVMEGPHSVIFDQAENRLHVQKAVLAALLSHKKS